MHCKYIKFRGQHIEYLQLGKQRAAVIQVN